MLYPYKAAVLTLSDKGSVGERDDLSGPFLARRLNEYGFDVVEQNLLPDELMLIEKELIRLCDEAKVNLILTTGGTGFSTRDVTPEATKIVIEKEVPGIAEAIRAYSMTITKRAMLSRGVSGIRNNTLIVNLPGSLKAVQESLEYILDTLEHGLGVLVGNDKDCARS
jgi:molybdenum cofactor synthesis domain-containing protein